MTLTEYAKLAQRTASTKTKADKIGHGCLGLIGEAGEIVDIIKKMKYMGMPEELGREKLIDECGDGIWYVNEWCTGSANDIEPILNGAVGLFDDFSLEQWCISLLTDAISLWDNSQDGIMYHYQYEDICRIAVCLKAICHKINVTLEEVLEHNIEKLKKRYPEGFSVDRSNERYEHEQTD